MAAIPSAPCVAFLMSLWISTQASTPAEVNAYIGKDCKLTCQGPKHGVLQVLQWRKPDLESNGYIFFFRENRLYKNLQDPYFRDRVELTDPEMKNGNFSVTLKNVNINDTGTYECYFKINSRVRRKRDTEVRGQRHFIKLHVINTGHTAGHREEGGDEDRGGKEGGDKNLHVGLGVGLPAALLVVVGFLTYKRSRGATEQPSYEPPPDEAGGQQLV